MAAKLRQVHRFVEILGHLLADATLDSSRPLQVVDMGAGKGYLTFALAHALRLKGWDARVLGVELRPELVESGNVVARDLGFEHLRFVAGAIGEWQPEGALDVLVALHACDTATDDALFQGVQAGAALLLSSPCCHRELRPQMRLPTTLSPVGRHGILLERQAEILTDALRAELLEMSGYSARVFEFVEPEHSGKNLMLAGVRRSDHGGDNEKERESFRNLWSSFGLRSQRLASLLGEQPE
jgi:2-polyprenyl-3-methyl-5-hydroxy-6-metoxy-1,4-benzoquinol methylase